MCGWKDRCRDGNLRTYCHVSPILFGWFFVEASPTCFCIFVKCIIRPDLLDILLLELAQLQNSPGWPVKKINKKVDKAVIFFLLRGGNDKKATGMTRYEDSGLHIITGHNL